MARTTLYLVRHGEQQAPGPATLTTASAVPGEADPGENDLGLSDRGRVQAQQLARRLAGTRFDTIHHSSLPRAEQTATILAQHLPGVPMHTCDLVKDRTPFPADPQPGRPGHDYPQRYQDFFEAVPLQERDPGAVRLQQAVEHLSALSAFGGPGQAGQESQASRAGQTDQAERVDLVVTHNFVIGWFVRHVMQAPHWCWLGLNQANCGLTVLQWETGRPATLISFNDVGHLS
ncbi:phosphoglycerate mutase [Kineosporia sp. NBRC 101677]|uniref:histidine phosphatase family protein n=1 Tax=Kineosporia sp. NBRC 101677 TaxID=3032197 RepID=UPI0024A56158|nr:histidine phosphatase family protein [Kineosporia sp. NBRC 101677]GLY16478.1 phosphoglycerate mutase [Kineosporia sp. NBRC 101677]